MAIAIGRHELREVGVEHLPSLPGFSRRVRGDSYDPNLPGFSEVLYHLQNLPMEVYRRLSFRRSIVKRDCEEL